MLEIPKRPLPWRRSSALIHPAAWRRLGPHRCGPSCLVILCWLGAAEVTGPQWLLPGAARHRAIVPCVTLLRSMNGALAFVDTSDCTVMNIAEHYMASDVEWDPTGRYVVTSVSWWSHKVQALPGSAARPGFSSPSHQEALA